MEAMEIVNSIFLFWAVLSLITSIFFIYSSDVALKVIGIIVGSLSYLLAVTALLAYEIL